MMIQLGEFLANLIGAIPQLMYQVVKKAATILAKKATEYYTNK